VIRFIDLGKQIAQDHNDPDWPREFCFYDTLQASFLSFSGQQIFDSYEDVIDQMDDSDAAYIKRIMGLIPAWVPRGKRTMVS
jgi:hypothetical protein